MRKEDTFDTTLIKNSNTEEDTLLQQKENKLNHELSGSFEIEQPIQDNRNPDSNNMDYIYEGAWPIAKNSLQIGVEYAVIMICMLLKDLICFAFCRNKGFAVVESVTAMSIIFDLFSCVFPWAISTLYLYNASEAYSSNNGRLFGILTNKLNFILLISGLFMSLFFCILVYPIYSGISTNQEATDHLTAILRWVAVGNTFWYVQFTYLRLLGAIEKGHIATIVSLIALVFQAIWLIIFIEVLELVDFGVGGSISIGMIISTFGQMGYFYIWKPFPESIINIFEGIFTDFWSFFCSSLYVGLTIFLTYFTMDFIPFLAIIISDDAYTVMNMLVIVILFFTLVSEGLNIGNSVLLNYVIGKQTYSYIYNVFIVNIGLVAIYSLVAAALVLGLLNYICLLFTDDQRIIDLASEERVYLFFTIITASYHNIFSESTLACGGETWGLVSIVIGRFGINLTLTLTLIYTGYGKSSVLLGFIVGQTITIAMNASYMYYLFRNNNKQLNINMLEMSTRYDKLFEPKIESEDLNNGKTKKE